MPLHTQPQVRLAAVILYVSVPNDREVTEDPALWPLTSSAAFQATEMVRRQQEDPESWQFEDMVILGPHTIEVRYNHVNPPTLPEV